MKIQMNTIRGDLLYLLFLTSAATALVLFSTSHAQETPIIVINEIMWDGTEYIELYNPHSETKDLVGWKLLHKRPGKEVETIIEFTANHRIEAQGYFLIEKNEAATEVTGDVLVSSLTLLNSGELLILQMSDGSDSDRAGQEDSWFAGENTDTGVAMERTSVAVGTDAVNWHTATERYSGRDGSPRQTNSVGKINTAPEAEAGSDQTVVSGQSTTVSAEDSIDSDGDTLSFSWDLGDGTTGTTSSLTHTYTKVGVYTATLTVSDGTATDSDTLVVTVTAPSYSSDIIIHEVLPDPVGSDTTGEFIEIKNIGNATVDLSGWKLDDADGGSSPYVFPSGTTIPSKGLLLFMRGTTKLALNNTNETVRVLAPDGTVKASFAYGKSTEGQSLNWIGTPTYVESTTVTPGQENSITEPEKEESGSSDEESDDETTNSKKGAVAGTTTATIALKDIRKESKGTRVTTSGVVSVTPGLFGEKIFYLSGSGIQVYNSDGDFPNMAIGNTVTVTGNISSLNNEMRLMVESGDDIEVTHLSTDSPKPHEVKTGSVTEDLEGSFVMVYGTVSQTRGDTFYLDDGSGEVRIVIKETTGIDKPAMKKGVEVTVIGVVSETKSGYRILPRFQEDVRIGRVAGLKSFPATGLQVVWTRAVLLLMSILYMGVNR